MSITLDATWNDVRIRIVSRAENSVVVDTHYWRRSGPYPFPNPDGTTTNVYGPFEWHKEPSRA